MTARTTGMVGIVIASLLWGTTGTASALAPSVSAITVGAGAMGIGGLLQIAFSRRALYRDRAMLLARYRLVIFGGVCVAAYPLAFYSSMRIGGVALGCVVSLASAPLASAVIERVCDGRALTRRWALACGFGIVGSVLLSLSRHSGDASGAHSAVLGVVLGLAAGGSYAGYSWAMRRLMDDGTSRGASAAAVLGLGGILLMPVFAATAGHSVVTYPGILIIACLAVLPMFLGYVLFSHGLARVGATTATTITLVEPAAATVLSVVILHETVGSLGWVGVALIAAALVVLTAPGVPAPPGRAANRLGRQPHDAVGSPRCADVPTSR
ncbi:EamA family transporter [Mycobacterium sp. 852013-50091_SCH5140682]|uniref:DMT family transporter n=1 Tax=Mycobacterium sp. 852013-50091_SCH5140682 TaxID=1834109 RepID=UPI0012EA49FB|nr:EamA family transporter [Mycobacterium sp. 852013-50091_SCH5140682]